MIKRSIFILLFIIGIGCNDRKRDSSYFSLESGLTIVDSSDMKCLKGPIKENAEISPKNGGYRIKVTADFRCQDELDIPYLTISGNGRRTLVLLPKENNLLFSTSCSCTRSLTIDINDRLEPGIRLYVVNDREVVGDVLVP